MSISMALFSPPFSSSPHTLFYSTKRFSLSSTKHFSLLSLPPASSDNGYTSPSATTAVETPVIEEIPPAENSPPKDGAVTVGDGETMNTETVRKFEDSRWVKGNWDLKQFVKDGKTDWDGVIVAEARRRKWIEENPESSSNEEPVLFDTSIIPWWAWMKRYHLPEAELLNGRAAMIGFFMAYFVDSLTGVGVVDQMGNFFCKALLFVAVAGILFIRKNDDVEKLKKLFEETTLYDKQWQATWKDETSSTNSM